MLQHGEDVFAPGITYTCMASPSYIPGVSGEHGAVYAMTGRGFPPSLLPGFNHPVLSSWFL